MFISCINELSAIMKQKTKIMKRVLVLISALAFLTACNQEKNNFENHEWILHYWLPGIIFNA